jgi:putative ABC transport system permease protein
LNSYTFHINLYDLLFVGMIFIGFNFALLLWFGKNINRIANRPLVLALVVMILWMVRILAIDIRLESYLPGWDRLPMQFLLALGPLIYFYVLKITRPDYQFGRKDLLHFSPLLIEQGVLVLEIRESTRTGAATYDTFAFQQLNPVLQVLIFISVLTYLYRSHQLIQSFYRGLQPVLMDRSLLEFRWLRRLFAATALLWLLWIAYATVDYFGYRNQLGTHVYYPFYIFFTVIIIWTAAAAFLKPQAGLIAQQLPAPKPSAPPEMRGKGAWLKQVMEANCYYQDPELSLTSLAEKLGLTTHELSRIINTTFKKSFNDFINEYRARDTIAKMQDSTHDHITLLGIAFESGFNSQSTFYRTFKLMTGKSPVEYKNSLEKEYSSYNLGNQRQPAPVFLSHETTPKWSVGQLNRNYMLRNYLKIAFRNLLKNKGFTTINVLGLALGLATCLLIVFYVFDELSYDRYNLNADRIYRINSDLKFGGNEGSHAVAPAPAAAALKADFPRESNR